MEQAVKLLILLLAFIMPGCGEHTLSPEGFGVGDRETAKGSRTTNTSSPAALPDADVGTKAMGETGPSFAPDISAGHVPKKAEASMDVREAPVSGTETMSEPSGEEPMTDLTSGTLTAGSFDDALNLDVFSEYWKDTMLAKAGIDRLAQPNWQELIPEKTNPAYEKIDISFVVDVTGSMGDELSYLQVELDTIAEELAEKFPNIEQRYGMVAYRDVGDEFVTNKYDFTHELSGFHRYLNLQKAQGGGDYPEAMHEALWESTKLQWGGDSSAKIMFLVADAPPHEDKTKQTLEAVFALQEKGVSIYPVAASGVADLAESVMRTSALLTGGQYIFLTDDSGIGNSHALPKFPCYHVEKLKDVMVRVISDELAGKRSEPDPSNLIRTVGHPVNGICRPEQHVLSPIAP